MALSMVRAASRRRLRLRCLPRRRYAVLLTLAALAAAVSRPALRPEADRDAAAAAAALPGEPGRVSVWDPDGGGGGGGAACTGRFAAGKARAARDGFPVFVVREVAADYRAASAREAAARGRRGAFVRLVLYVTVHLSVALLQEGSAAAVERGGAVASGGAVACGVAATVEYVVHINPFVRKSSKYVPGAVTRYKDQVTEWQVVVALAPVDVETGDASGAADRNVTDFRAALHALAAEGADLLIAMAYREHGAEADATGEVAFKLACALSWEQVAPLAALRQPRPVCNGEGAGPAAAGAVALGGSPLHGAKARDPVLLREVANFCARSLHGPVAFDSVAVPVLVNESLSEVDAVCGGNVDCVNDGRMRVGAWLRGIAERIEEELSMLDVPPESYPRVVVLPVCRLGSFHEGSERGRPCGESYWGGQYISLDFVYNLVGSSFRWAVSYDLDEYIAPLALEAGERQRSRRAAEVFDGLNRRGLNAMRLTWLNFQLTDAHYMRPLTRSVMKHIAPALRNNNAETSDELCYGWPSGQSRNGKAALRCDNGLGFTIHAAVQLPAGKMLNESDRSMKLFPRSFRVWHPRASGSLGKCHFVASRME